MDRNRVPLAVEDYLAWLYARGLKDTTIRSQRTSLQFLIDATGDIRCSSLTIAHVERMLQMGAVRGWGARTKNIRIEHAASFIQWCKQHKLMPATAEPMLGWRPVKVPERRHLRIPPGDWEALLAAAPWPVDRAMVAVGLHLCLRISEITSLKVGDLHLDDYTIDITRHKTGQLDTMPISLELAAELRTYVAWYTNRLAEESGIRLRSDYTLFPPRRHGSIASRDGSFTPLSGKLNPTAQMRSPRLALQNILRRAGYTVGPGDREGWHTLRRSGSRALWQALSEQGSDYATRTVQAMLGHESSTTTEKYLGIEIDRTRRDRLIRGQSIFGSMIEEGKVIPLRKVEGE